MKQYLNLLDKVLNEGEQRSNRTGIDTLSLFGAQMRFNLQDGFPLVTTKKVHFHSVLHELLWFISGSTNIKYLKDNKVSIWNEWADSDGELGPVYGKQWRKWEHCIVKNVFPGDNDHCHFTTDQLKDVIDQIKTNPDSRRLIVSAWNPADIPSMALPPCHLLYQFQVSKSGHLNCQMYQRSADMFLGVPFNIASYALLTCLVAQVTGLIAGELIHTLGDYHIYINHIDQVKEQLSREPKPLPSLYLNKNIKNIDEFTGEDIMLLDYVHYPAIKAEVAI